MENKDTNTVDTTTVVTKRKRGRPRKNPLTPEQEAQRKIEAEHMRSVEEEEDQEQIALDVKKVKEFEKQEIREVFHDIELSAACMNDISLFVKWVMDTNCTRTDVELRLKTLIQHSIADNQKKTSA